MYMASTMVNKQWQLREDKRAQNSTTEVSSAQLLTSLHYIIWILKSKSLINLTARRKGL